MRKTQALKQILKSLASDIQKAKEELKDHQRESCGCDDGRYWKIERMKYDFRHQHIAYCLLNGTDMPDIESKPKHPEKK